MLHKYIDKVFGKSVKNKNKLIPADYESRIMNVLDNLPEISGNTQKSTETQVHVVKHEKKIYFRSFAAAAAVVLMICGISVHNRNITTSGKPGKNNNVTTIVTVTSTEKTTTSVTEKVSEKVSSSLSVSQSTTVVQTVTETSAVSVPPVQTKGTPVSLSPTVTTVPAITENTGIPADTEKTPEHTSAKREETTTLPLPHKPDISGPVPPEERPSETKLPPPDHEPGDDKKPDDDFDDDDREENMENEDDNDREDDDIKEERPDKENENEKFPHDGEKPVVIVPPGAVNEGHIHIEPPCCHGDNKEEFFNKNCQG